MKIMVVFVNNGFNCEVRVIGNWIVIVPYMALKPYTINSDNDYFIC